MDNPFTEKQTQNEKKMTPAQQRMAHARSQRKKNTTAKNNDQQNDTNVNTSTGANDTKTHDDTQLDNTDEHTEPVSKDLLQLADVCKALAQGKANPQTLCTWLNQILRQIAEKTDDIEKKLK